MPLLPSLGRCHMPPPPCVFAQYDPLDTRPARTKALTAVEETVQDTDPETQAVDGNTLVDTVKHAGEVQVWRQLKRGEAKAAQAEPAERFGVRAPRQAVRDHPRA